MDLTWKDKLSFQLQEIRSKLPFSDQQKKQNIFLGEMAGISICLLIFLAVGFTFLLPHTSSSTITPPISQNTNNQNISSETGNKQTTSQTQPQTITHLQVDNATQAQPSSTQTARPTTLAVSPTTVVQQKAANTPSGFSGKFLSGTTSQNTQAIYGTNTPPQGSTTDISQVTLYFKDSNGDVTKYVDSSTPPINLSWQTYINDQDKYAIDIPIGWQIVKTQYNGHEGVAVFPPGSDPTLSIQEGLKQIGLGISPSSYDIKYFSSGKAIYSAPITINGFTGTLYTQGSYGANTVAAIITYGNVFFGIGGTANSDDMIYVFQHMLASLQLYGN